MTNYRNNIVNKYQCLSRFKVKKMAIETKQPFPSMETLNIYALVGQMAQEEHEKTIQTNFKRNL